MLLWDAKWANSVSTHWQANTNLRGPPYLPYDGMAMRLCSYVVVYDSGFAPNPFWGLCTLAACTPNHQGLRLKAGEWLIGNSSARAGHRLIYAMRVSEVLDFDKYYRDPRFEQKERARSIGNTAVVTISTSATTMANGSRAQPSPIEARRRLSKTRATQECSSQTTSSILVKTHPTFLSSTPH